MGYPIHKIIDFKKLMLPKNIVCHTNASHVIGNKSWKYVTCTKCLKRKENLTKHNSR